MTPTAVLNDPSTPPEPMDVAFRRLSAEWEGATCYLSSMEAASRHRAYRDIIALGPAVLPLLLRDLEERQTHWFIALREITGATPIPESIAGNIPKMAEAWLTWARDHGIRW